MELIFSVEEQTLTRIDNKKIVAGSFNYLSVLADFSEEWTGLTKTILCQCDSGIYPAVFDNDNTCLIPYNAIASNGNLSLAIRAESSDKILTTNIVTIPIGRTISGSLTDPSEPIPDIYHQLMDEINSTNGMVTIANAAVVQVTQLQDNFSGILSGWDTAETLRKSQETGRINAENGRVSAENARAAKISAIETDITGLDAKVTANTAEITKITSSLGTDEGIATIKNGKLVQMPTAADVGAVPVTRKINNKPLSGDISLVASDISAVPTSRKINGVALTADVNLTAANVGARASTWLPTAKEVGAYGKLGDFAYFGATEPADKTKLWFKPPKEG